MDNEKILKSSIADHSEDYIAISYPIEESGGLPRSLAKNERILLLYTGTDHCQYEFATTVIGRRKENIPLFLLARPKESEIKRTQRRLYFRVPTNLRIDVQMLINGQSTCYEE